VSDRPSGVDVRVEHPSVCVLTLTGRLDAVSAREVRERAAVSLERGHRRFLVDASELDFIEVAGFAPLVWLYEQVRSRGGRYAVVQPRSPEPRRLFVLTGFDRIFDMTDDVEQARVGFGLPAR